jgi:hypothetical protein
LCEIHLFNLFDFSDNIVFFYGAGVHAGYQKWNEKEKPPSSRTQVRSKAIAGIDGLAGLEYIIPGIPLSAGIEMKPYADFFGRYRFNAEIGDFAFTVKYLF